MDLYYKDKLYKSDLSLREVSYELGIPKSTLSRYLKNEPTYKTCYFEQRGEKIEQFYFGKKLDTFIDVYEMSVILDISVKACKRVIDKKELWFHKYFSISPDLKVDPKGVKSNK